MSANCCTRAYEIEDEQDAMTDIVVETADAKCATATFTFRWSGRTAKGQFDHTGRGTMVLIRHEGKLKIRVEHLSR